MFVETAPPPEKRLTLQDTFRFDCHQGLSCFNTCCQNKHLPLTPYDVLRLRRNLNLHSDTFLERHTLYRTDPHSGFPVVLLRMNEAAGGRCPFLGVEGCNVYADRPTACRLYPLCRVSGYAPANRRPEAFFYMLDLPRCLGRQESRTWTVGAWHAAQGLDPYSAMNDRMLELIFHPRRASAQGLDERQLQKILVACYNLDIFREFVLTTGFLDRFEVPAKAREHIAEDDSALLDLGFAFLRKTLFPPD